MTDMIDRLDEVAREAGASAAATLVQEDVRARIEVTVRAKVRRRRARRAMGAAAVVLVAASAAWAVPRVWQAEPLPASTPQREVVTTGDGIITYDDGSMSVMTSRGRVVPLPPPAADAPRYAAQSGQVACAQEDVAQWMPGWTSHVDTSRLDAAASLITFGRPMIVDDQGYRVIGQGQSLGELAAEASFAFSVDADAAVASHLVVAMDLVALGADGLPAYVATTLDSQPVVERVGDRAQGTAGATVTTRPMQYGTYCPDALPQAAGEPSPVHLRATVFVSDGKGAVTPLASHQSWFTVVREAS